MTLQWIPLDQLQPHPDNSNRMPARLMEKLRRHIERTGLYEPLVVRPMNNGIDCRAPSVSSGSCTPAEDSLAPHRAPSVNSGACTSAGEHLFASESDSELTLGARTGKTLYQILNGHHRAEVLRQLGHTHARCDVWNVSDEDALVLLATLNRLEGRDDPAARARLVAKLAGDRSPEDLARLLPEPADAIERLMKLAEPPPAPLAPADAALAQRPMTFFLTEEQHAAVTEALREAGRTAQAPASQSPATCMCDPDLTVGARNDMSPSARAPTDRADQVRAPTVRSGSHTSADETLATQGRNPELTLGARTRETRTLGARTRKSQASDASPATCSRADALERLALWYLEARNLR